MTLPSTSDLEQSLLALPLVGDASWTSNISAWIARSSDRITWLTGILPTTSTGFTFNQATFQAQLATLVPTGDQSAAANSFFSALEAAILASIFLVSPGAYLGSPGAATTWSAVASVIPDPAGLAAAKAAAVAYMSSAPVSATKPTLANSVRIYFTSLTYTVTGTNSAVPPAPLVAAAVKVY